MGIISGIVSESMMIRPLDGRGQRINIPKVLSDSHAPFEPQYASIWVCLPLVDFGFGKDMNLCQATSALLGKLRGFIAPIRHLVAFSRLHR